MQEEPNQERGARKSNGKTGDDLADDLGKTREKLSECLNSANQRLNEVQSWEDLENVALSLGAGVTQLFLPNGDESALAGKPAGNIPAESGNPQNDTNGIDIVHLQTRASETAAQLKLAIDEIEKLKELRVAEMESWDIARKERDDLANRYNLRANELQEIKTERDLLKDDLARATRELEDATQKIESLSTKSANAELESAKARKERDGLSVQEREAMNSLAESQRARDMLVVKMQNANDQILELRRNCGKLEQDLASAKAELDGDGKGALELDAEKLAEELESMREKYVRTLADGENWRKRQEAKQDDMRKYGASGLAREILNIHDFLTTALAQVDESQREGAGALVTGIESTSRELVNALGRQGITPFSPNRGDSFDPKLHEALFEKPDEELDQGQVASVFAEGFMLHDRLLRPAKVCVAS